MAQEPPSQFAPSWFSTLEASHSLQGQGHHARAYGRLWRDRIDRLDALLADDSPNPS